MEFVIRVVMRAAGFVLRAWSNHILYPTERLHGYAEVWALGMFMLRKS